MSLNIVNYLNSISGLREIDRTVSAQEVSPNDNGILRYPIFFPVQEVNSTRLGDIQIGTYRPIASRREWNGPGRLIPVQTPDTRDVDMVPVEAYFTVGEYEIQKLEEQTDGDEAAILRRTGNDVEGRTDGIVESLYRLVERDAFYLWATGKVIQDDPTTGDTIETDFKFGADRIQTALTPWDDTDGYDNLIAWLKDAQQAIGRVEGAMLSTGKFSLIRESAPTLVTGQKLKRAELEDEIADELGNQFRFVTNDDTLDIPRNGGLGFNNTLVWPTTRLAAIPGGGRVGMTAKAPVARAGQLSREFPQAGINRRGAVVYYLPLNDGKGAKIAAQVNMMGIPAKPKVFTIDIGTPE